MLRTTVTFMVSTVSKVSPVSLSTKGAALMAPR
jgi:hypothetical protein